MLERIFWFQARQFFKENNGNIEKNINLLKLLEVNNVIQKFDIFKPFFILNKSNKKDLFKFKNL